MDAQKNRRVEVQEKDDHPAAKMTVLPGCGPEHLANFLEELAQESDTLQEEARPKEQEKKETGGEGDYDNELHGEFSEWETVKSVPPPKTNLRRSVSAADRLSYLPGCTPKDLQEFEKLRKEVEATPLLDPTEVLRLQKMEEKKRKTSNPSLASVPTPPSATDRPKMLHLPGCSPKDLQKYQRKVSTPIRMCSVTSSTSGANEDQGSTTGRSSTWEEFAFCEGDDGPLVLTFPRRTASETVDPEENEKKCKNIYTRKPATEAEELLQKPVSIQEWSMREQSRTIFHRAFSCCFACLKPCFK